MSEQEPVQPRKSWQRFEDLLFFGVRCYILALMWFFCVLVFVALNYFLSHPFIGGTTLMLFWFLCWLYQGSEKSGVENE